ncbi:hypothetical protein BBJ28_00019892 [Nothophytophthora sp. Chile5]|nr:hypothetical protein BBJ28_00019892 [Nothophytophthora sp. Chile5]
MTDRRRKRKTPNSSCDDTVKDFNAVAPSGQARRSSDCGVEDGAARSESWMAKVTLAVSHRIFSGGKKLNGSRSTQVMPLVAASKTQATAEPPSPRASCSSSSSASTDAGQKLSSSQSLRLVASEKALASSLDASPVLVFDGCPSVTCDIASEGSHQGDEDDDDDNDDAHRSSRRSQDSSRRRSHRHQAPTTTMRHKVAPGDGETDDEEATSEEMNTTRVVAVKATTRPREGQYGALDAKEGNAQETQPVLKGFFSRNVSASQELREQQRGQRRETLYRDSKRRHDQLREQRETEQAASEETRRKRKVEQLRRLNQQRRRELLRDAASARAELLQRVQVDQDKYRSECQRWEDDFEDEMRVLSSAFRKTQTSVHNRPMTVAGLAVPEAMAQLEREASGIEKRLKTAQPALTSMIPRQRPSTCSGVAHSDNSLLFSSSFSSCDILVLEDSKDGFDLFETEEQTSAASDEDRSYVLTGDLQRLDLNAHELAEERESLLQRLAVIEHAMQTQKQ